MDFLLLFVAVIGAAGLCHRAMHSRLGGLGRELRTDALQRVLDRPGHHLVITGHQRFEPLLGDLGRIIFFPGADLGVPRVGAAEEISVGGAGQQEVTVTPVSLSSSRKASEKEKRNASDAAQPP
jgi:hypothetical protein